MSEKSKNIILFSKTKVGDTGILLVLSNLQAKTPQNIQFTIFKKGKAANLHIWEAEIIIFV